MRSMFAYFTPTNAEGEPITIQQRCLGAMQVVASLWMVAGLLLPEFVHPPAGSSMHDGIRMFSMGSLLISAAIYSVLLPLRHILKEKKD